MDFGKGSNGGHCRGGSTLRLDYTLDLPVCKLVPQNLSIKRRKRRKSLLLVELNRPS